MSHRPVLSCLPPTCKFYLDFAVRGSRDTFHYKDKDQKRLHMTKHFFFQFVPYMQAGEGLLLKIESSISLDMFDRTDVRDGLVEGAGSWRLLVTDGRATPSLL